jgi:hypothetical protein
VGTIRISAFPGGLWGGIVIVVGEAAYSRFAARRLSMSGKEELLIDLRRGHSILQQSGTTASLGAFVKKVKGYLEVHDLQIENAKTTRNVLPQRVPVFDQLSRVVDKKIQEALDVRRQLEDVLKAASKQLRRAYLRIGIPWGCNYQTD